MLRTKIREYMETRRRIKMIRKHLLDIDVKLCGLDMALNVLEDGTITNPETNMRFVKHARLFTNDLRKLMGRR